MLRDELLPLRGVSVSELAHVGTLLEVLFYLSQSGKCVSRGTQSNIASPQGEIRVCYLSVEEILGKAAEAHRKDTSFFIMT
jgi:hypothetical protein